MHEYNCSAIILSIDFLSNHLKFLCLETVMSTQGKVLKAKLSKIIRYHHYHQYHLRHDLD